MNEVEDTLRNAWLTPGGEMTSSAVRIARLAADARRRSLLSRCLIVAVLFGTAAWGVFELVRIASPLARIMGSLPFFLFAGVSFMVYRRYQARATQPSSSTADFLRDELGCARDECLWFASWRGFALVLSAMWLMIATRITAAGPAEAFAHRGFAAGMAIAVVAPIICSAIVFFFWRLSLRRSAAARQLEIDHLGLIERTR